MDSALRTDSSNDATMANVVVTGEVDVASLKDAAVTARQLNDYAQLTTPSKLDSVNSGTLTTLDTIAKTDSSAEQLNIMTASVSSAQDKIAEVRCSDDLGDALKLSCSVDATSGSFDGTASDCTGTISASYVETFTARVRDFCVARPPEIGNLNGPG